MKLSVIVPAFNEEILLLETIGCIRAGVSALAWPVELIVCDNNSADRTAEIARGAGATVVFEPVNQIARARNAGAACASGDWLIFIDADTCPSAALFTEMALHIESGNCLAGGSTIALEGADWAVRLAVSLWNRMSRMTRWAAGAFIFCEAAAFREIGGFNEEFYASEEIDFSRRMKKHARRRGRSMVILHRHPLQSSARKARLYSWREMSGIALKSVLTGGNSLKKKDNCFAWYDGRR